MPKPIALDKPCEVCGKNEWWDNTASKKNAKMPDFKCANKECKTDSGYPNGRWLPKGTPKAPAPQPPQGGRITGDDTTPDEQGQRVFTYEALCYTYSVLLRKTVEAFEKAKVPLDPNAVQAAVATLLIQGEKARIPLLHPRKVTQEALVKQGTAPAKKKELPPIVEEEFEEVPESELPF